MLLLLQPPLDNLILLACYNNMAVFAAAVPDAVALDAAIAKATLVGGWGVSQPLGQGEGGEWTTGGCGSDLDQHVRTPETTSFSLELDWQDTILEMEDMAETTATATAAK